MTGGEPQRVPFPDQALVTAPGWLSGLVRRGRGFQMSATGDLTVMVPLRPLTLPEGHPLAGDSEDDVLIQFSSVPLPAERVRDLAGLEVDAPSGAPGWPVWGEMRIAGSYVGVELRRLRLGALHDGILDAELDVFIDFEHELGGADSGFLSRSARLETTLELDAEPVLLPAFTLYGGRFAPTTTAALFIETDAESFAHWLAAWIFKNRRREASIERVTGALDSALARLSPLRPSQQRRLVVPTRSSWCAYFDNCIGGTDPSPVGYFPNALQARAVRIACGTDARILELYGAETRDDHGTPSNHLRTVMAMDDGSWIFHAEGEQQPFEQPGRYGARRVKDRFTPDMLADCLAALGIRAFDERFYMPDGEAWLVDENRPPYPGEREYTYEEVQAGLPWRKRALRA